MLRSLGEVVSPAGRSPPMRSPRHRGDRGLQGASEANGRPRPGESARPTLLPSSAIQLSCFANGFLPPAAFDKAQGQGVARSTHLIPHLIPLLNGTLSYSTRLLFRHDTATDIAHASPEGATKLGLGGRGLWLKPQIHLPCDGDLAAFFEGGIGGVVEHELDVWKAARELLADEVAHRLDVGRIVV